MLERQGVYREKNLQLDGLLDGLKALHTTLEGMEDI